MNVLITRPKGQEKKLLPFLEEAGFSSRHMPLLKIDPIEVDEFEQKLIADMAHYNGVVVVSPNAAIYGMKLIKKQWPKLPEDQVWVTNGETTKEALAYFGVEAIIPSTGTSSENIIRMPELRDLVGQHWLIIKGIGGRNFLTDKLKERGAQVSKLSAYQRSCPSYDLSFVEDNINWAEAIMVTSAEALENFDVIAGHLEIRAKLLIVSSPRLQKFAKKRGWLKVILAAGASDKLMVRALINYMK